MAYVRNEMIKAAQAASIRDPTAMSVLIREEALGVTQLKAGPHTVDLTTTVESRFSPAEVDTVYQVFGVRIDSQTDHGLGIRVLDVVLDEANTAQLRMTCNRAFEVLTSRSVIELASLFRGLRGNLASPLPPTVMYAERSWRLACDAGIKACLLEQVNCLQKFFLKSATGQDVECVALFLNSVQQLPIYVTTIKLILKQVTSEFNLHTITNRFSFYMN
eukprot:TRINITY_DN48831_c0_g1_i1.p1 TRINITY_DN48831_c0_g1~~TRINITY_DN48831_c0_g1_i1.p1  ORF type:complete len:218 (-),score=48.36 TRINITY_DN48831_c0_g1_i1:341-994(-)